VEKQKSKTFSPPPKQRQFMMNAYTYKKFTCIYIVNPNIVGKKNKNKQPQSIVDFLKTLRMRVFNQIEKRKK
jgi:hypothetical protein